MNSFQFRPSLEAMDERIVPDAAPPGVPPNPPPAQTPVTPPALDAFQQATQTFLATLAQADAEYKAVVDPALTAIQTARSQFTPVAGDLNPRQTFLTLIATPSVAIQTAITSRQVAYDAAFNSYSQDIDGLVAPQGNVPQSAAMVTFGLVDTAQTMLKIAELRRQLEQLAVKITDMKQLWKEYKAEYEDLDWFTLWEVPAKVFWLDHIQEIEPEIVKLFQQYRALQEEIARLKFELKFGKIDPKNDPLGDFIRGLELNR